MSGGLFPSHSRHSGVHCNGEEEKVVAKDNELIFIFRDSWLTILGLYVCICTALEPIHGMSEKSFTLHSIFSIISLTVLKQELSEFT